MCNHDTLETVAKSEAKNLLRSVVCGCVGCIISLFDYHLVTVYFSSKVIGELEVEVHI